MIEPFVTGVAKSQQCHLKGSAKVVTNAALLREKHASWAIKCVVSVVSTGDARSFSAPKLLLLLLGGPTNDGLSGASAGRMKPPASRVDVGLKTERTTLASFRG